MQYLLLLQVTDTFPCIFSIMVWMLTSPTLVLSAPPASVCSGVLVKARPAWPSCRRSRTVTGQAGSAYFRILEVMLSKMRRI